MNKELKDKKPRWEKFMVEGKSYTVRYRYNGNEFQTTGTFKEWNFGNFYFECDDGEWLIVKPFDVISAATI